MTTYDTAREIPATIEHVFAAISTPERLAKWWGPAGFTNTFESCEFKTGGHWTFTMHGPDGKNYTNTNVFVEVDAPKKVVIGHVSEPVFTLTIGLAQKANGTLVTWSQNFESDEVAAKIKHIVLPANEQNLDRLTAEVMHK